jgi:ribosomal protein L11 methyltransferase
VPVSDESAEGLTNFLWELGALGVVEESAAGETGALRAFFADVVDPGGLDAKVRDYVGGLRALGLELGGEPRVTPLADQNWAEAWREHFRPVPIGRRLVVAPPWIAEPFGDRLVITIDPGRAFGTGHHGSTAGCLLALEAIVDAECPAHAIDIGTGSGVLAIAAVKLGVSRVLAFDDDPDAVSSAAGNASMNGVQDRIQCVVAEASALADAAGCDPAPLVLANLLSAGHQRLAPRYRRLVEHDGALVLGGILDIEADSVERAVGREGFAPDARHVVGEWVTLVVRRTR